MKSAEVRVVISEDLRFVEDVSGSWLTKESFPESERQAGNMSVDHLSNMLSSIKNASLSGKPFIEIPYTKECEEVAKNLESAGFLEKVKVFKPEGVSHKMLHLDLGYNNGVPLIREVKRVSKPGKRVYKGYNDLGQTLGGFGVTVVSTSRGVMNSVEARKKKLGGEVICQIY